MWEMQSIKQHPWFILQTNYDHWNMPLPVDDRRSVADRCMSNMTQKVMPLQFISVIENVVNKRGKNSIGIQSCWGVSALSMTNGRHIVQEVDGGISIT